MKQVLLALALIGFVQYGATAQSKNAINYKICMAGDQYKVCDASATPAATKKTKIKDAHTIASLRRMDTYVHMGYFNAGSSNKRNPRIIVMSDDPQAAYEGKDSRMNDGVKKNIDRNINYMDNSMVLPGNDGSSPLR